jgi:predicted kinase
MKKRLIIVRGLPGSGKSTLAKKLVGPGKIFSTDDYHVVDGVYKYNGEMISEFHERNLQAALESMEKEVSPIVIDNTNISFHFFLQYIIYGLENGYSVEIVEAPKLPIDELMKRNVHDVPRSVIEAMDKAYETNEYVQKKLEEYKSIFGIEQKKKFFPSMSSLFVSLNILNILDKAFTWYSLKSPEISELNPLTKVVINYFGLDLAMIIYAIFGVVVFYLAYLIAASKRLYCEKNNMPPEAIFTGLNLIFIYIVLNNLYWAASIT